MTKLNSNDAMTIECLGIEIFFSNEIFRELATATLVGMLDLYKLEYGQKIM